MTPIFTATEKLADAADDLLRAPSRRAWADSWAVSEGMMRFAYADPPYFGLAKKFYGDRHAEAAEFDQITTHASLIARLSSEYPDGWALSMTSGNLRDLLPLCPPTARVMAWVKPFASFKPGVGVAYAWEPVVINGGRRRERDQKTVRDWLSENITLRRGFPGAKPARFVWWMLDILNAQKDDEIDDLFPGSGAVQRAIDEWRDGCAGIAQGPLFAPSPPSEKEK